MKTPLKLLSLLAGLGVLVSANVSCTPTEAAIVGGLAGAAIGAAVADSHYDDHYYHRGYHGPRGYPPPCRRGYGHRGYYY